MERKTIKADFTIFSFSLRKNFNHLLHRFRRVNSLRVLLKANERAPSPNFKKFHDRLGAVIPGADGDADGLKRAISAGNAAMKRQDAAVFQPGRNLHASLPKALRSAYSRIRARARKRRPIIE